MLSLTVFGLSTQVTTYAKTDFLVQSKTVKILSYADKVVWKYKMIDGKMYKCKYNMTTSSWIGDWILVRCGREFRGNSGAIRSTSKPINLQATHLCYSLML